MLSYLSVRPSVLTFQNRAKQNKSENNDCYWPGPVGLAEGIINDTFLVEFFIIGPNSSLATAPATGKPAKKLAKNLRKSGKDYEKTIKNIFENQQKTEQKPIS